MGGFIDRRFTRTTTRLDSQQWRCTTLSRLDDTRTSGKDHLTCVPCSMISGPRTSIVSILGPWEAFPMGTVARERRALPGRRAKFDRSFGGRGGAPPNDPVTHNKTMRTYVRVWWSVLTYRRAAEKKQEAVTHAHRANLLQWHLRDGSRQHRKNRPINIGTPQACLNTQAVWA